MSLTGKNVCGSTQQRKFQRNREEVKTGASVPAQSPQQTNLHGDQRALSDVSLSCVGLHRREAAGRGPPQDPHRTTTEQEQPCPVVPLISDTAYELFCTDTCVQVALLGMDIVSALVSRLQTGFQTQIGTVLPSLTDRLGDPRDQVRDQAQDLLLKIKDQAATPQVRDGAMTCLVEITGMSGRGCEWIWGKKDRHSRGTAPTQPFLQRAGDLF
ncbi:hypothetical protein NFI96_002397 [Prochilodus magdalenae]|nr:hypothetical protein NFI96_002397 [Prochilodus magdalenae]